MTILRENLEAALQLAIAQRQTEERLRNYSGDSAILQGWKQVVQAIENGEKIEVR